MSRFSAVPESLLAEPAEPLLAWGRKALQDNGYHILQPPGEVRRRSWSIVIDLPTDHGTVWLKANARAFAYEAGLLELLSNRASAHVLRPIATDVDAGWFLCPDGGQVLGDTRVVDQDRWQALLAGYAELQQATVDSESQLRELEVPDMTPPTLVDWYRAVLDRAGREQHVRSMFSQSDWQQLIDLQSATARWSQELAADGLPTTVEHNDLHAQNVFVADGLRIFDWGDAALAHPFSCLRRALTTARESQNRSPAFGEPGDSSPAAVDIDRLRNHYLHCWLPANSPVDARIRRSAALAEQLSWIVQAASWLRLPPNFGPDWAGWFASFLTGYADGAADLAG